MWHRALPCTLYYNVTFEIMFTPLYILVTRSFWFVASLPAKSHFQISKSHNWGFMCEDLTRTTWYPSRSRTQGEFFREQVNSSRPRHACFLLLLIFPPLPRTTSPSASILFKTTKVRLDPKKGLVVGKGRVVAKQPDVGKRGKNQGRAGEFPTSVSKGGKHPFTKGYQNVASPTFLHEKWKR